MKHLAAATLAFLLIVPAWGQDGIRVTKVKGSVDFQKRGEPGGNVTAGQVLPADSQIQTREGSSAELKFPDGSIISVGPSTRFRLSTVAYGEAVDTGKFNIDYGKILAKFSKIEKKRDYQFITPTSVAGVRGTAFGLGVSQGADQLVVTEGSVALGNDRTPAQVVSAGQFASIGQEGFATPPRAASAAEIKAMEEGVPGGFSQLGQAAQNPTPVAATTPAPAPEPTTPPPAATTTPAATAKTEPAPAKAATDGKAAAPAPAPAAPAGAEKPFGMGFDFGPVVMDGQTMTRIALAPEIRLGKFGIGFDVEVFLDGTGKPSSRGWDFSSAQATLDSIFRKITYIQWSQKAAVTSGRDPIFFRLGQLDRVTLGMGYIMDGYNNGLRYPAEKALGLDLALGVGSGFRLGFEYMINNFADLANNGMIMGGRLFVNPFGAAKSPILKGIQIGTTYVADFNQYAGLRTSTNGESYTAYPTITNAADRLTLSSTLQSLGVTNAIDLVTPNQLIRSYIAKQDYFGMWGADFMVPLIGNSLLVYGQMAMNHDLAQTVDTNAAVGWGFSAPAVFGGISLKDGTRIFSVRAEFRHQEGAFQSGYFNRNYDTVRARPNSSGIGYQTGDFSLSNSVYSGVYGWAELYLVLFYGSASYEALFAADTGTFGLGTFQAKLVFNKMILRKVPAISKILNNLEGYFVKRNIANPLLFWQPSPDMTFGYDLDLQLGGTPVHVINRFQMTYSFNAQGKLVENSFFSANVAMKIF